MGSILLLGCSRKGPPPPKSSSSQSAALGDTLANGLSRAHAARLEPWLRMWRRGLPGFNADSLKRGVWQRSYSPSHSQPLDEADWWVTEDDSAVFLMLGAPSPDARYRLVPNALAVLEVGGEQLGLGEVDSEAQLVDLVDRRATQVAFCGTPCTFDWGCWLDSSHFVLAGTVNEEGRPSSSEGFLWIYSLTDSLMLNYYTRTVTDATLEQYQAGRKEWLKGRYREWKTSHGT